MDINPTVKVQPGVPCKPVVCLLEDEKLIGRDGLTINLNLAKQIRSEGERIIAVIFQITESSLSQEATKPIREYLEEMPEELKCVSLLTTHWNHIRAIMVHQEMEYRDLEEICNAYYETITEVSFNQEFTKGWLMSTITTADVA